MTQSNYFAIQYNYYPLETRDSNPSPDARQEPLTVPYSVPQAKSLRSCLYHLDEVFTLDQFMWVLLKLLQTQMPVLQGNSLHNSSSTGHRSYTTVMTPLFQVDLPSHSLSESWAKASLNLLRHTHTRYPKDEYLFSEDTAQNSNLRPPYTRQGPLLLWVFI